MTRKRYIKLLMGRFGFDRECAIIFARIGLRSERSYAAAYEYIARYREDKP